MQLVELEENEYKKFTEEKNAHFLESYEWGEVSKFRGYKVYYLGLKDKDNVKATALILKKVLPLNYSYFYIPRGFTIDYNNVKLLKELTIELKKFAKKHKAIFFRIDPDIKLHTIDENANKIDGKDNYEIVDNLKNIGYKHRKLTKYFETMQPRFTFRIPLENSIENIESKYTNTTKSRIKKAINSEISVEVGNKDDIKEFVRLMKMTEKRQDFYSHDLDFYEYFYDVFSKSSMVTLYLGKIDIEKLIEKLIEEENNLLLEQDTLKDENGKKANNRKKEIEKCLEALNKQIIFLESKPKEKIVVSSYLTVKYNDKAWALYAANDMEYKNYFPNYLVYKRQIEDSFNDNRKIFDVFGTIGDPKGESNLLGLHDFKKKWGGEYTEFIGEFDFVINKLLYFVYIKLIPFWHKLVNKKLKKGGK